MVRLGIHGDVHRRAECLSTLGPLHAWRRWSPVILGTDEHEQGRVGPVVRPTGVLSQAARVKCNGGTEVALRFPLVKQYTEDSCSAIRPPEQAHPIALDIGALPEKLQ